MKLITLLAKRVKEESGIYRGFVKTEFYKPDGTLYATIPASNKQPRKDKKQMTLNCFTYAIKWEETPITPTLQSKYNKLWEGFNDGKV